MSFLNRFRRTGAASFDDHQQYKAEAARPAGNSQPTYAITDAFFVLITSAVNIVGWFLCFVCMIAIESNTSRGSAIGWVAVLFTILVTVAILLLARHGNLHPGPYRFALAQILILLTALQAFFTDKIVVLGRPWWFHNLYIFAACLQMGIQSLWAVYLGCDGDTIVVQYLERFDSARINAERRAKRRTIMSIMQGGIPQLPHAAPVSPIMIPMPNHGSTQHVPPMNNLPEAAAYGGTPQYTTLENGSPVPNGKQTYEQQGAMNQVAPAALEGSAADPVRLSEVSTNEPLTFNFKAKALYPYTADPNDPTEISFEIGEELDVANPHGNRWWQARKKDGTIGIAPSNYLQLIQE